MPKQPPTLLCKKNEIQLYCTINVRMTLLIKSYYIFFNVDVCDKIIKQYVQQPVSCM